MTPATDVVIPIHANRTFPAETVFQECVRTVCTHTHNFRFIFVLDDCDQEALQVIHRVAASFPEANLIQTYKQHWFTRAVNLGLRLVRTPWCMLLNCDTVVDTGWLDELYAVRDEVEATTGRVGLVGSVMSEEEPRRYQLSVNQDYVTGHALLLNMHAITEASMQHGTPGLYFDETRADAIHIRSDIYICRELNLCGWQCVKSFKAKVGHHGFRSWGAQLGSIPGSLEQVNYKY